MILRKIFRQKSPLKFYMTFLFPDESNNLAFCIEYMGIFFDKLKMSWRYEANEYLNKYCLSGLLVSNFMKCLLEKKMNKINTFTAVRNW